VHETGIFNLFRAQLIGKAFDLNARVRIDGNQSSIQFAISNRLSRYLGAIAAANFNYGAGLYKTDSIASLEGDAKYSGVSMVSETLQSTC